MRGHTLWWSHHTQERLWATQSVYTFRSPKTLLCEITSSDHFYPVCCVLKVTSWRGDGGLAVAFYLKEHSSFCLYKWPQNFSKDLSCRPSQISNTWDMGISSCNKREYITGICDFSLLFPPMPNSFVPFQESGWVCQPHAEPPLYRISDPGELSQRSKNGCQDDAKGCNLFFYF